MLHGCKVFFHECEQLAFGAATQHFSEIGSARFQDATGEIIASFCKCDDVDVVRLPVPGSMRLLRETFDVEIVGKAIQILPQSRGNRDAAS